MPKTSHYYSAVERVPRGRPPKCRSDDSGLDASWKPDEDEIACELDDDEVTSDGKSAEEDDDDDGEQEEEREQLPRGRPARGAGASERKGGPGRKKQPQEWKDHRKPTKGLRELQALIDGSAQLHQDKRTRRQQPTARRRYRNGNASNGGKVDYMSYSSGDSSWSGSSYLGSSRQEQAGTSEPQKVVVRGAVVRRMKMPDRAEGFEESRKRGAPRSHKKSALDRSLEGVQVRVASGGSAFPNSGGAPCEMRSFKSGGSGVQRNTPEQNPSKRQRLDLSAKESTDQGENGGAAENAGAQVRPSLSDGEEDLVKEEDLDMKHEEEEDGAGPKKPGRSTFKLPRMPMIKHEKAWYRARILKTERERVFVEFTGFEDGSLVKPFWIRKDSERIFTGSYRGKDWKYLGDGAWQPKPPSAKPKKKQRGPRRKRRVGPMRADTEVTGRTKDSNSQGMSQEEETNMETDNMDAAFNSNQNEHKSDAAVENSEVAQIPVDTGQALEFTEVEQKGKKEAKPGSEELEARRAGSGGKPGRGMPRNGTSDTAPGNRDSGNNRRDERHHGRPGANKAHTALDYARNAEEYESRMRNPDDQSESGVSPGERNTADKNSGASTRGNMEGSGPSRQQERGHKGKVSQGVLSEGVGSGGDSQGSEACGTTSKKGVQGNPVSQSDTPGEDRNAAGREGPDDAVCSSPSSATPDSGREKEEQARAPADGGEGMPNPSNQEQEQIEQGDGIRRSARVAQLGWKGAWKRSNRGEARSGDDPDAPDEDLLAPRGNRTLPHAPTHPRTTTTLKSTSRSQSLKRKSSVMIIDTSVAPRTRQLPPKKPATIDRGVHHDSERGAGVRGNHAGKGGDTSRGRSRPTPRVRSLGGGVNGGAGMEEGADRNSLMHPPMGWTGGQPIYWMNGSSALSHIRKHLPYYSSHISDEKLESYVEMMERLDDVSWGDLPATNRNQGATSQRDDKMVGPGVGVNGARVGAQQPGASHHQQLNQFVQMPMGQTQSQPSNVQMPLPWTALSPLFYPSVVQFPNWMPSQQSIPPRHQAPPSAPSFPQKLNRNPGSGSGGSQ